MTNISKALGIEFTPEPGLEKKPAPLVVAKDPGIELLPEKLPVTIPDPTDIKEDYQLARKTFRKLIKKGDEAVDGLGAVAKETESVREAARVYEVMANLMKTVSDTTKDLFTLQKMTKDLMEGEKKEQPTTNVNVDKAVFVGTTSELIERMKQGNEQ